MIGSVNNLIERLSSSADYTATLTTLLVLIFILVFYLVVFKVGTFVIGYMMDYKGDPYIFRGKLDFPSNRNQHFFTNPMDRNEDNENLRVILRSDNERTGIEFSWSVWLYVDARNMNKDVVMANTDQSSLYHMFNKGGHVGGKDAFKTDKNDFTANTDTSKGPKAFSSDIVEGMAIMSCPGMYLKHSKVSKSYHEQKYREWLETRMESDDVFGWNEQGNHWQGSDGEDNNDNERNMYEYVFTINTMNPDTVMETISVPNIPLNLWTHVVFRCINHKVDVYVNGRIKKRTVLSGIPRQNYGDIYVAESYQDPSNTPKCKKEECMKQCGSSGGAGGSSSNCKTACGIFGDRIEFPEFHGNMSDLRYFNYALQARTIEYYTEKGPNLKPAKRVTEENERTPYYLTQRWHYTDYLH